MIINGHLLPNSTPVKVRRCNQNNLHTMISCVYLLLNSRWIPVIDDLKSTSDVYVVYFYIGKKNPQTLLRILYWKPPPTKHQMHMLRIPLLKKKYPKIDYVMNPWFKEHGPSSTSIDNSDVVARFVVQKICVHMICNSAVQVFVVQGYIHLQINRCTVWTTESVK